jgi:glycine cleavage system H protein
MSEHDLLSPHATKAIEYLLAVAYLLFFIPFSRALISPARPRARSSAWRFADWFYVPDGVYLHKGHAWARPEPAGVAVGLDEFVHDFVGAIEGVELPALDRRIRQGRPAFGIRAGGKSFTLRAPVSGRVTDVNERALSDPAALATDPYGAGWLFRVTPDRLDPNLKSLFSRGRARRFLAEATESLYLAFHPEALSLAQDGGLLVHGIARELDPEHWDDLVRSVLMSR